MIASVLSYHWRFSHPNSSLSSHNYGSNNRSKNWSILNITWDHWTWKWVAAKWRQLLNGSNHLLLMCAKILHLWLKNHYKKPTTITDLDSSSWSLSLSSSRLCMLWSIITRVIIFSTLNISMFYSWITPDVLGSDNNYLSNKCLEDTINASILFMDTKLIFLDSASLPTWH